jgi:hypothetical protein
MTALLWTPWGPEPQREIHALAQVLQ